MKKSFILFTIFITVLAIAALTEGNVDNTLNDNMTADINNTTILRSNGALSKDWNKLVTK